MASEPRGGVRMLTALLIAVGAMCAITAGLTVAILIAEATVGNYGEIRLTVNGKRDLTVTGGRPLLGALRDHGIFIPSACGGRGSCGLCKLSIPDGGEPVATELPWLSKDEVARKVRLCCQVKVKRPLRIEIPEELLSVRQYRTVVTEIRDLTHDIKEVRLRLEDPPEMEFVPGQFVQFEVPPYDLTDEPVYRAYSISSDARNRGEIELQVRYVPNGICTTYVHQHLRVGMPAVINGPYGDFRLQDTQREIVFVAGGSGMAPIRSMLLHMAATRNPRKARYYYGVRSRRDLYLVDEMRELERTIPDFRFIPTLSRSQPEDQWNGEKGRVTVIVDREVPAGADAEAYLCGSPLMIDACVEILKAKGLPGSRIFFDKFA